MLTQGHNHCFLHGWALKVDQPKGRHRGSTQALPLYILHLQIFSEKFELLHPSANLNVSTERTRHVGMYTDSGCSILVCKH